MNNLNANLNVGYCSSERSQLTVSKTKKKSHHKSPSPNNNHGVFTASAQAALGGGGGWSGGWFWSRALLVFEQGPLALHAGHRAEVGLGSLGVMQAVGILWHARSCFMRNLR